jgi:enoyl-CoA hydratase/carnithine racemase
MLPQAALAATKSLINSSYPSLREANEIEREAFLELWAKDDHLEALAAFREKRKPAF